MMMPISCMEMSAALSAAGWSWDDETFEERRGQGDGGATAQLVSDAFNDIAGRASAAAGGKKAGGVFSAGGVVAGQPRGRRGSSRRGVTVGGVTVGGVTDGAGGEGLVEADAQSPQPSSSHSQPTSTSASASASTSASASARGGALRRQLPQEIVVGFDLVRATNSLAAASQAAKHKRTRSRLALQGGAAFGGAVGAAQSGGSEAGSQADSTRSSPGGSVTNPGGSVTNSVPDAGSLERAVRCGSQEVERELSRVLPKADFLNMEVGMCMCMCMWACAARARTCAHRRPPSTLHPPPSAPYTFARPAYPSPIPPPTPPPGKLDWLTC